MPRLRVIRKLYLDPEITFVKPVGAARVLWALCGKTLSGPATGRLPAEAALRRQRAHRNQPESATDAVDFGHIFQPGLHFMTAAADSNSARDPSYADDNLIWIDMEMTGLQPEVNRVIEVAAIITDRNLNILHEGPVVAVHQKAEILDGMDAWNTETHTKSGLVKRVLESTVDEEECSRIFREVFRRYVPEGKSPGHRYLHRYRRTAFYPERALLQPVPAADGSDGYPAGGREAHRPGSP